MFYIDISHIKKFINELNKNHDAGIRIQNYGQLESALEKPRLRLYGKEIYPEIYQKAAVLMEAINKLHTLTDGNKRIAMIAAECFVRANGCYIVMPGKAVRFSVDVAKDKDDLLSKEIQKWFKTHVATNPHQLYAMLYEIIEEQGALYSLIKKRNHADAKRLVSDWLAFEIYPEKEREWEKYIKKWKEFRSESQSIQENTSTNTHLMLFSKLYGYNENDMEESSIFSNIDPENMQYRSNTMNDLILQEKKIKEYENKMEKEFNSEAFLVEGIRIFQFGYWKEALSRFGKVLEAEPDNLEALEYYGGVLFYDGRRTESLSYFEKVISAKPDDYRSMYNLALASFKAGKTDDAIKNYRKTIKINPKCVLAVGDLAALLFNTGRHKEAKPVAEEATRLDPNNTRYLKNMAVILGHLKEHAEAFECVENALRLDSSDIQTVKMYVDALLMAGDESKALQLIKETIRKYPALKIKLQGSWKFKDPKNRLEYHSITRCTAEPETKS